jgi:hypothetical protein
MLLEHANIFLDCLNHTTTNLSLHKQHSVHTPAMSAKIQKVIARQKSK